MLRSRPHCEDICRNHAMSNRGFTMTEMMVAVAVLLVVIIATARIFSTTSAVTGLGQATATVLQDAAAIERQFRADIERLTSEGFLVIHCVAVRNDVRGPTHPLLNPNLPPNAIIRADQLLFFANGAQPIQSFRLGAGDQRKGHGTASRIYYGHAFQLPNALPIEVVSADQVRSHDSSFPVTMSDFTWANQLPPWFPDSISRQGFPAFDTRRSMVRTVFNTQHTAAPADFTTTLAGSIHALQPQCRRWTLVRQAIVLADDDSNPATATNKVVFLNEHVSAPTIVHATIRNSRVDAAAQQLNDLRRAVAPTTIPATPPPPPPPPTPTLWDAQRNTMRSAMFYPRAERHAPGPHRVDQALTTPVISSACSSFRIEWTYNDGVGFAVNSGGGQWLGVQINPSREQPWFGISDIDAQALSGANPHPSAYNGVGRYGEPAYQAAAGFVPAETIFPAIIESATAVQPNGVIDYWATFGYNQARPLNPTTGEPWLPTPPENANSYTPFPSAIRVTMTLHDPEGRLEGGREFQFVVDLPRKVN